VFFIGLGLLSKPYAIAKGGWISIPILGILSFIANICGKVLVSCYETPQCINSSSYADVVNQVMGYWPAIFMIVIVILEWIGGVCIVLLFMWANLETMLTGVSRLTIAATSTAMALPTIWILTLSDAWWLTLLGFISTICIVFTLIWVRIYYGELGDVDPNNTVGPYIPLSTGIFILSLSGHSALPQVYREMSKPDEFNWVMNFCFTIIFLIYIAAGISGYLIYGNSSDIIITTSLVKNPGGVIPKIISWLVVVKNYLVLNPYVAVLCDSTEIMMGIEKSPMKMRIFRSFAFLASAGLAYLAYDAVPFVESICSAICTMLSSFIFPAILFAILKEGLKSWKIRCASGCMIVLGFIMMGFLTYGAINSLFHPDA